MGSGPSARELGARINYGPTCVHSGRRLIGWLRANWGPPSATRQLVVLLARIVAAEMGAPGTRPRRRITSRENPKFEFVRNPKQIPIKKFRNSPDPRRTRLSAFLFWYSNLFRISTLGFSDFLATGLLWSKGRRSGAGPARRPSAGPGPWP